MEKNFIVKKARNGKGVFVKRAFASDSDLFQIKGTLVTCFEDEEVEETIRNNVIRFDEEMYISPDGEIANFANHSCAPNAKIAKKNQKLYLVAITDIQKDEEIVFDYSTITARDDIWTMKCNCGSDDCRNIVKRFTLLPRILKDKYQKEGIVPQYILNI